MYLCFNHKQKNVLTTIYDKKFPIDNNVLIDPDVADITTAASSEINPKKRYGNPYMIGNQRVKF